MTTTQATALREAFEQHAQGFGYSVDPDVRPGREGGYWSSHTHLMWETWKAAIGVAATSAGARPTMYLVPDDCPRDDFDQPIIYITNEVNLVAHSLTGSEGEEDALTELKGMVRYVENVWPGKTALQVLLEYEEAALPSAKRVPLTDEQIDALVIDWSDAAGYGHIPEIYMNGRQLVRAALAAKPAQEPAEDDDLLTIAYMSGHFDGKRAQPSEQELFALLPYAYYMDPPDGGSPTLLEQLQRMAKDARRYRWLRMQHWSNSTIFVVADNKSSLRLGTRCPSTGQLDGLIDAELAAPPEFKQEAQP